MDEDDAKEAFVEGKHAARAGVPITACPHDPGTSDWRFWTMGWSGEVKSHGR